MPIKDVFQKEAASEIISDLKQHRFIPQPDVTEAEKALDPTMHDINDPIIRPDKKVRIDADENAESAQKIISVDGEEATNFKTEKVARVAIALQRLIIKRVVSFCFGNPPKYNCSPVGEQEEQVYKAVNRILYDVKSKSLNRKIGRAIFGYKECAELWYPVESNNNKYGFKSKYKLRCMLLSPAFGDVLYPYFDETGDMVAFSREFVRKEAEKDVTYFDTYTAEQHWLWRQATSNSYELVDGYPAKNPIGKIPVVFGYQSKFETEDVNALIDRLEVVLSNFADTNDYHASPKIFVTGQINGWSKKGESGAVIEGEDGSTMKYVSWESAPESVKLEIQTLLKLIYTITQTPDISFDAVKGLGAISGIALKLLFMDAHLKVQDKCEIFDDYLQRRVNVILAFVGQFNTNLKSACETIEIEPEIVPYMITNEMDDLNYWMTANGNKPVISQEESIVNAGLSADTDETIKKLKEQAERENSFVIGEPHIEDE